MAFPHIPRYLAPFHPKRSAHRFTDVLILGGGLAGLRAALEVDPKLSVMAVSKGTLALSNSQWAQGGIASVLDPEDRFENHIADTLTAGGALCDEQVVEFVIREAPKEIARLIEWGARFDETEQGKLDLGREGGHSHHRIVHALGDATGREVMRAVIQAAGRLANLETWEHTFILDLLTFEGVCRGAVVWNASHGTTLVWAKQTILATGGAGQIYRETTNPPIATGDGHAVAYRAGAELRDMEFFQFHPTVLYIAGMERHLITEAVRGDGAYLLDNHGHRFMRDYDPRGELAPRDVVSRAIVAQMEKTSHPNVYLSLAHLDPAMVRRRFPGMARLCAQFNLDVTRDPIPVRPGAHYMVGGATTDCDGRTTLNGLWAAGEVTSTGLHGANRLASNSLLEAMVFGARCGAGASAAASEMGDRYQAAPLDNPRTAPPVEPLDLSDIQNSLRALMWRNAGILRDETRLDEAAKQVDRWCGYVLARQLGDPVGWQLQNMLLVARLLIEGARRRKESRGVHMRLDYPNPDP
ncbi:MAG TPA: L-aspartate oxidase, partial [Pirellulales bacterium]